MIRSILPSWRRETRRRGLTLIEVIISTMLTGVVMLAALNSLGAASRASLSSSQRAQATALASDLMNEVMGQAYLDPDGSPTFGPETGESTATRADFDDIDDYAGWNASPPQDIAGNDSPMGSDWRREVAVVHANPDDTRTALDDTDDQGVKRIKITIKHKGDAVIKLFSAATPAWPPASE